MRSLQRSCVAPIGRGLIWTRFGGLSGAASVSLTDVLGGGANKAPGEQGGPAHFSLQDIAKQTGGTAGRVVLGEDGKEKG